MVLYANIFESILPWLEKSFWLFQVVIAFGVLVAFHEFGHYISAKLTGMKVEEFAIGFGKRLLGIKSGETEYSIRLVPLGGYCRIFGMEDDYPAPKDGEERPAIPEEDVKRAFNSRPIMARFLVIIAGSLMNVVLAITLVGMMGSTVGFNYALVDKVEDGSPAQEAGLIPGDKLRLYAYNSSRSDIINAVSKANPEKGLLLRVARDDGQHNIRVHPELVKDEKGEYIKRIGIAFDVEDNYSRTIDRVMLDSPYDKAGLQPGDEIVSINGESIDQQPGLISAFMDAKDNQVEIGVLRDDKQFTFILKDHLIYRSGVVARTVPYADGYTLKITDVIMDTPAFYMGIRNGMLISEIDGNPVTEDFNWAKYESESTSNDIMITISDEKTDIEPISVPLSRVMLYPGITVKAEYVRVPVHQAFYEGALQAGAFVLMIGDFFYSLFHKQIGVGDVAGPIGIFTIGYKMASEGMVNLVFFIALISVNLGIINLLPLPGLDGGRAVFLIGEMIFRRPLLKAQFENLIHLVGILILFGIIIFVTIFDVDRVISMFR